MQDVLLQEGYPEDEQPTEDTKDSILVESAIIIPDTRVLQEPRANTVAHQITPSGDEIKNIFGQANANVFQLLKKCLVLFPKRPLKEIVNLICEKDQEIILQKLEGKKHLLEAIRTTNTKLDIAKEVFNKQFTRILKQNGFANTDTYTKQFTQSKSILNFKAVEAAPHITQQNRLNIIKALSQKPMEQYLRPVPHKKHLEETLGVLFPIFMSHQDSRVLIDQVLSTKSMDILKDIDTIPGMEHISLSKLDKNRLKKIVQSSQQFKDYCLTEGGDLCICQYEFVKAILLATTVDVTFPLTKLDLKYQIIQKLKNDPYWNICEIRDRISRQDMTKIVNAMDLTLKEYQIKFDNIKPLQDRKRVDVASFIGQIPPNITPETKSSIHQSLMNDEYIKPFSEQVLGTQTKKHWNFYNKLPNCKDALEKSNKDVKLLQNRLRRTLRALFTQKQVPANVQEWLVRSIIDTGELFEIVKCQDLPMKVSRQLVSDLEKNPEYLQYKSANFSPRKLEDEVRWELIDILVNIQSADSTIKFSTIAKLVEQLINLKSLSAVENNRHLSSLQKQEAIRKIEQLMKKDSKFKKWCHGDGVDLEQFFVPLSLVLYQVLRRENNLDCELYKKIVSQVKETGKLDCIKDQQSLAETKKKKLITAIESSKEYQLYNRKLSDSQLSSLVFKLIQCIKVEADGTLDDDQAKVLIEIITKYVQYRPDLDPMRIQAAKPVKELMNDTKFSKVYNRVRVAQEYKDYCNSFDRIFEQKDGQIEALVDHEVNQHLTVSLQQHPRKIPLIKTQAEKCKYDIAKLTIINNDTDQMQVTDSIISKIGYLPAVIDYKSHRFVKDNRNDLIAQAKFKSFTSKFIQDFELPAETKKNILNLLSAWNIREVTNHQDLSFNQKKLIFSRILKSQEFEACVKVVESNFPTKNQNLPQGVRSIIEWCMTNQVEVSPRQSSLAKKEVVVRLGKHGQKTFKTGTSFKAYYDTEVKPQFGQEITLFNGETQVNDSNFESLAMREKVLELKPFKKIKVVGHDLSETVQLPLGQSVRTALLVALPVLEKRNFQISSGSSSLEKAIVTKDLSTISVENKKEVQFNGQELSLNGSATIEEIKSRFPNSIIKKVSLHGKDVKDTDTLDSLSKDQKVEFQTQVQTKQVGSTNDQALQVQKDFFKNPKPEAQGDESNLWASTFKDRPNFDYAYNKIFEQKDAKAFQMQEVKPEVCSFKKIKKRKIVEYLNTLPEYARFKQLAGIQ